ncbi:MAG: AarF/ABC1/UbiB kinase family protein, partial [Myxococcota bacterium]
MSKDEKTALPRGRLNRLGRLVGMTARVSGSIVQSKVQKALGNEDSVKTEAAQKILSTLGEMKGAALKLGQTLSLGANHLPPEVRGIVSQLFSQAPALDYEQISVVLRDELGRDPEEVFAEFDREPFAAASLGQVHRAKLQSGEDVAVKVQYPGVADALVEDMKNASVLVKTLGMGTNLFDGKAYFNEVRDELEQELDYQRELALLEEYRTYLEPWDDLTVPRAYPELSAKRVLTLERFEGPTLHEYVSNAGTISREDGFRIGEQLTRAVYGPFFLSRVVHADTHPGNFIVRPDKTLGGVDFGAVKRVSEPVWRGWGG